MRCHRRSEGHCGRERSLRTGDLTGLGNHSVGTKFETKPRASFYNNENSRRRSAVIRLLGLRVRIPPWARMSVYCECCVLSGRCLCVGPLTCPEESCRVWCRSLSVIRGKNNLLHLQWVGRVGQTKKERKKERKKAPVKDPLCDYTDVKGTLCFQQSSSKL